MYFFQTLLKAIWAVLGWFWQIAVAFGSYLGIVEGLAKYVITFLIIAFLASSPFPVSRNDKKSARNAASVIVDIFSSISK